MTMGSRFKVSKWRVCKVFFFLVTSLNKFLREVDTVTKSAGGAAVRCPETCTGAARQRRGFDRADDDMRVRSDVLSCICSLSTESTFQRLERRQTRCEGSHSSDKLYRL